MDRNVTSKFYFYVSAKPPAAARGTLRFPGGKTLIYPLQTATYVGNSKSRVVFLFQISLFSDVAVAKRYFSWEIFRSCLPPQKSKLSILYKIFCVHKF